MSKRSRGCNYSRIRIITVGLYVPRPCVTRLLAKDTYNAIVCPKEHVPSGNVLAYSVIQGTSFQGTL